jgi:hypothetical protein
VTDEVLNYVGNMSTEELEAQFARGLNVLVPIPGSPLWLDSRSVRGKDRLVLNRLSLQACYNDVLEQADALDE